MSGLFSLLAEGPSAVHFEWGRDLSTPAAWLLPLGVFLLLAWFVVGTYLLDCVELGRRKAIGLISLRLLALAGILLVYLQPQWRARREIVQNSRVLLLVDTSQSMGRRDVPSEVANGSEGMQSRIERVVQELQSGPMLGALRKTHDVAVYRFDQEDKPTPVATLAKFPPEAAEAPPPSPAAEDWPDRLVAQGASTKLGQAVFQLVLDERATPVSAIVVFSDGQRTAGMQLEEAAALASEEKLPVYTIGLGSRKVPQFVRLADFSAPARAYVDDPFEVTAYLQSEGLAGRGAVVTLKQIAAAESSQQEADETGVFYQAETTLGVDREDVVPVLFDVEGLARAGRYAFQLEVQVKGQRPGAAQTARRFYVDVLDRQTRVLLIAGGPTREFRFLRSLLQRDKYVDLDLVLQSVRRDRLNDPSYLAAFPGTRDELARYDAVIALDPDWTGVSPATAAAIEQWVSEDAGGLIVIPGNVHAGNIIRSWVYDPDYQLLRDLYPVHFLDRFAQLADRPPGSPSAWPLEFTRAGDEADFLRLDDNPAESQRQWSAFGGVYGGYPAKGAKYGATVYARFADSLAEPTGFDPIYFAGQFYGKGRVFYIGSGEMWRLRQQDEAYFEQFYTRLIRHITMGRLHQGSARGDALLLEKEQYHVGDTVPVVAHLKNAARQPLELPEVTLFLFDSEGRGTPVKLVRDAARPGTFRGEFVARQAEDYRLDLLLPESDQETLSKVIKVTAADLENRQPQQNDQALRQLAEQTGGRYFPSLEAAHGETDDAPLVPALEDQTRVTPVAGDVDPVWKAAWARWMMFAIVGLLSVEWLLRRLFKLA